MKRILPVILISTLLLSINSVSAQEKTSWKELDAFHEVMSKTFHPTEEGKFEPIRSRSAELLQKAIAWESSTAPKGYDKNAVAKSLKKLVQGAREIDKLVKQKAADKVIKDKLSALHNVFHEIVEKCEKEESM